MNKIDLGPWINMRSRNPKSKWSRNRWQVEDLGRRMDVDLSKERRKCRRIDRV